METEGNTENEQSGRVHHGHNIRRVRVDKNISQEDLSKEVFMTQSAVSKYEKTAVIKDEILQRFAKALDVPMDYLKTEEENAPVVIFENITNNQSNNQQANSIGYDTTHNGDKVYNEDYKVVNPLEKITELYERLIKEKDEKYAELERRIKKLESESKN